MYLSILWCTKKIKDLTFDHIIPKSHGGKTNWLNVVSACRSCNFKKGNKSLNNSGMRLQGVHLFQMRLF